MKKIIISLIISSFSIYIYSCNTNNNYTTSNYINNLKTIEGKVEFDDFKTKAEAKDVVETSTVSLIYPSSYKTKELRGSVVSTGLTDKNGRFTLNINTYFAPNINDVFVLEATRKINNNNISLRTHLLWDGINYKAITKNKIFINPKTTAIAIISELTPDILPISQTIEKFNITNTETQINDITPIVNTAYVNQIVSYINSFLADNKDPISNFSTNNKTVFPSNNLNLANKNLSGCIGNAINCTNKLQTRNDLPGLITNINTNNLVLEPFIDNLSYGKVKLASFNNGFVVLYSKNQDVFSDRHKDANGLSKDNYYKTYDLYIQKYTLNGEKIGIEIKVSDKPAYMNDYYIRMYSDGKIHVVYKGCNNFYPHISDNLISLADPNNLYLSKNYIAEDDCQETKSYVRTYDFFSNNKSEKIYNSDTPIGVAPNGNVILPSYEKAFKLELKFNLATSIFYYEPTNLIFMENTNSLNYNKYTQKYGFFDADGKVLNEVKTLSNSYSKANFYSSLSENSTPSGFSIDTLNDQKAVSISDNDSNIYTCYNIGSVIYINKYDKNGTLINEFNVKTTTSSNISTLAFSNMFDSINQIAINISPNGKNLSIAWKTLKTVNIISLVDDKYFSEIKTYDSNTDALKFFSSVQKSSNSTPIYYFNFKNFHKYKDRYLIEKETLCTFVDNFGNFSLAYYEKSIPPNSKGIIFFKFFDKAGKELPTSFSKPDLFNYSENVYPQYINYLNPDIIQDPQGNFIVFWQTITKDSSTSEKGQVFGQIVRRVF